MSFTEVHQSRKRSPSLIAKMMGLDGWPPQQKWPSEVTKTNNPSEKKAEMENTLSNRLSRRSTKKQQEFKDAFEVSEASFTKSPSFKRIHKSNPTDKTMTRIRKKYADTKRLSTGKKLHDLDIFNYGLEDLYCNKDRKHSLSKIDFSTAGDRYKNEAKMKATRNRHNSLDFGCTPERRNPQPWKYNLDPQPWKSFQMEGEGGLCNMETKIVILKPNLGKAQNAGNTVSSPTSSQPFGSCFRTQAVFQSMKNRTTNTVQKKISPPASRFLTNSPRGSREIAKEVKTQMGSNSMFSSSRIYYYDESGGFSGGSANETEIEVLQWRKSLQLNNPQRPSYSSCKESFVSKEAKKRMSKRWKLTNVSQDKGVVRRSSTLAEMLAIPAKEIVSADLDSTKREKQFQNRLLIEDGLARWNEPLGISSRDGTKVACYEGSYWLRSSSALMAGFRISKTRKALKILCSDKYAPPEEPMKLERNKAIHLPSNREKKDPLSVWKEKESEKVACYEGSYDSLSEISAKKFERCNSRSVVLNTSVLEKQTDVGQSMDIWVSSPDRQERFQSPRKQETDEQSPISILEPPFKDDLSSSSDCFNSLSDKLYELRMQLQLLKLESEGNGKEEGSGGEDRDGIGEDESWEFPYICEVLSDSGLDFSDPWELKKTWLSPGFPVDPSIFDKLEKKHLGCTTHSRSERKLLFDRINGGIVEIFQPLTARLDPKWTKERLERHLYRLLISSQETEEDTVVERESQWLNFEADIEEIGEGIGRFLMDELLETELVCFS